MARWTRALRWLNALTPPEQRPATPLLDLGCAFGHTSALFARHGYPVTGVDLSADYIARAKRRAPGIPFLQADAAALPFADASFAVVLLLDVLEHVADDAAVAAEVQRVLRPSGLLLLSVPYRGISAGLDSLNLYRQVQQRVGWGLPAPELAASGSHRHYRVTQLRELFPACAVERAHGSGLGLAEPVNLALLLLLRGLLRQERLYQPAAYLYYSLYLLEDLLPTGHFGYHLMLQLRRS